MRERVLQVLEHPRVASGGMADPHLVAIYPLEGERLCHGMMLSMTHKISRSLMMQPTELKAGLPFWHQVPTTIVSSAEICPHQWIRHRPLKVGILID